MEKEAAKRTTTFSVTNVLAKSKSTTVVEIEELVESPASKSSNLYAVKIYECWREFLNESIISTRLSTQPHPNIIKYYDTTDSVGKLLRARSPHFKSNSPCIRMEHAAYGDLFTILKKEQRFPTSIVRYILNNILNALEYLHKEKGIYHRDIKLENILLCHDFAPKLADFGCSAQAGSGRKAGLGVGTTPYMAPELTRSPRNEGSQDLAAADIFALGVVLFAMYTGMFPFTAAGVQDRLFSFMEEKKSDDFFKEFLSNVPNCRLLGDDFKDLVARMLANAPEDRPTIDEIKKHSFCLEESATEEKYKEYMSKVYNA